MSRQPGFSQGVQLTGFGPREIEISNNLATVWSICFARIHRSGRANYPYIFLEASDDFKDGFSFRYNLLCIFHPFDRIDARLMDAIDSLLESNSNRLDRLCVLLVTNATAVDMQINPENDIRIHIPFRYQELTGGVAGKRELVESRLRTHLYPVDLFATSSVLKTDRSFFGRKEDVQSYVSQYDRGENSSLFGLRRIGKTSLLWAIVRELKHRDAPVVLVDCSDTKFHKTTWNKTLFRVKEQLYISLGVKNQGGKSNEYTEADASSLFVEDLKRIKDSRRKPILFIFDEVESLCFSVSQSPQWKNGVEFLPFWQTIRSAYQQNTNLFSILLCGTNPLIVEKSTTPTGADNPLFKYIPPRYLEFFNIDEVEHMLVQLGGYIGVTFDKQIFTYLSDDYGGHPFLVRQIASILREFAVKDPKTRRIHVRREDYQGKRQEITEKMKGYISLILSVLMERYPEEYELLRLLAAERHDDFLRAASEFPEAISHIMGYGLLTVAGGVYHFRLGAVEQVVRHNARDLLCPESIEERWSLIGRERNMFEWKCKRIVRQIMKTIFGENDAKNKIIAVMKQNSQAQKCQGLSFDEIFSEKGEIYFLDLKDIVVKEWDLFKRIFKEDKGEFQVAMDAANKYRIDTHAREITKENFRRVMPKLVWLHDCIEKNA